MLFCHSVHSVNRDSGSFGNRMIIKLPLFPERRETRRQVRSVLLLGVKKEKLHDSTVGSFI